MKRRELLLGLCAFPLTACETLDPEVLDRMLGQGGALSAAEVALGLKAALDNGIGFALNNLGRLGGFLDNPSVRIPLPRSLQDVQSFLAPLGADGLLVDLQTQLNRGAEKAVPVAKTVFLDAVRGLTIQDAFDILGGADDAATRYLQTRTTDSLTRGFSPIMGDALENTGALQLVDQVAARLSNLPIGPDLGMSARTDLISHGVRYGLDGVFDFIAVEEKAIRENPARRTSEILRRVFA